MLKIKRGGNGEELPQTDEKCPVCQGKYIPQLSFHALQGSVFLSPVQMHNLKKAIFCLMWKRRIKQFFILLLYNLVKRERCMKNYNL